MFNLESVNMKLGLLTMLVFVMIYASVDGFRISKRAVKNLQDITALEGLLPMTRNADEQFTSLPDGVTTTEFVEVGQEVNKYSLTILIHEKTFT